MATDLTTPSARPSSAAEPDPPAGPHDGTSDGLDPAGRDDVLVEMAALGRPKVEIGPAVGRSAKFVQRRLKDPDLARRVAERRAELVNDAVGRLGDSMLEAVDTMRAELTAERPADRLRAASLIVSSLSQVREQSQLDQTIAELREEIAALRDLVKGA